MKTDFLCPKCRGYLNVGNNVVFTIRQKGWTGGILLLSPELGDYSYSIHPSHRVEPGEQFDFLCPICHFDLSVPGSENMAKVLFKEDDRHEFYIVFSRKKGELCTYKISEAKIESSWGEHQMEHIDFLSASLFK
jgi:hypothetical protein